MFFPNANGQSPVWATTSRLSEVALNQNPTNSREYFNPTAVLSPGGGKPSRSIPGRAARRARDRRLQPLTWGHTPMAEMHFGLITQESHGFSRVECQALNCAFRSPGSPQSIAESCGWPIPWIKHPGWKPGHHARNNARHHAGCNRLGRSGTC